MNKKQFFLPLIAVLTIMLMACTPVEPTVETDATDKSAELSGKEEADPAVDSTPTAIPINETTMTTLETLENTSWHSPNLDGEESKIAPFKDQITLEFVDGQIAGSAGCNRYFASYTQEDDGMLTFSPIGSTMMACEPTTLMDAEFQFLQALQTTTTFTISEDGSQLILTLGEKGTLSFSLNS